MLYTTSDEGVEHRASRGGSHGALRVAAAAIGVASISPLVGGWLGGDGFLLDPGRLMTGALTGLLTGVLIWLEQHRRNGSHRGRGSDSDQNAAADELSGLVSANEPTREGEWSPDLLESSSELTERKTAEAMRLESQARLQHSQKLDSLGLLASGIAHDFNNVLGGIVNYANLALMRMEPQSQMREPLENIKKAAFGMSELCNQMLIYTGKGEAQARPMALSHLVEVMHSLVQPSISKLASLHYELAKDLPSIDGDAAQIKQILLNLVTNASDALQGEQGEIVVRTRLVAGESARLAGAYAPEGLTAEASVCLEVSDTGCGIDETTRTHMFDPFFTTKDSGRGLGLSSVLGIVRRHRAHILVQSALGEGTRVMVLFPVSRSKVPPIKDGASSTPVYSRGARSETVLFADDEILIR